jgi:peroxiredoxin
MARQLNPGDPFPAYTVKTVDGTTLTVPQDLAGEYVVLLFYRGHW